MPGYEVAEFQVSYYMDAPVGGMISRDYFVAFSAVLSTMVLQTMMSEGYNVTAAEFLAAYDSETLLEPIGRPDDVGGEELNMRLSHSRASSVREFLLSSGVPGDRVQAKGYGETNPVASNDTEEGRAANRRTEMIILEN